MPLDYRTTFVGLFTEMKTFVYNAYFAILINSKRLYEPSLKACVQYVDQMFNDPNDWCYFKILRKIMLEDFKALHLSCKEANTSSKPSPVNYKVPICLIPIMSFKPLKTMNSTVYKVKSACVSL